MKVPNCSVHSNLMGRYAVGHWREDNRKYKRLNGTFRFWSEKWEYEQDKRRPEEKDEFYWHEVTEKIVAVTLDKDHDVDWLKLWVIVDGEPKWLGSNAKVMPVGWEPNLR